MRCQHCGNQMDTSCEAGVEFLECPICEGLWFDSGALGVETFFRARYGESNPSNLTASWFRISNLSTPSSCPRCSEYCLVVGAVRTAPFWFCGACDGVFLPKDSLSQIATVPKCPKCGEVLSPERAVCMSRSCKTRSITTVILWAVLVTLGLSLLVWYLGWVSDHSFFELVPWWWF